MARYVSDIVKIAQIRQRLHCSNEHVAKALDVHVSSVDDWAAGRREMYQAHHEKLDALYKFVMRLPEMTLLEDTKRYARSKVRQ